MTTPANCFAFGLKISLFLVLLALHPMSAYADSYTVGGSISNLVGSGLVLRLDSTYSCIDDNGTFTLQSTDTNDCFLPRNFHRCCSQAINQTATDGISTVTCTCGFTPPVGDHPTHLPAMPSRRLLIPTVDTTSNSTQTDSPAPLDTTYVFPTSLMDLSTFVASIDTQPTNPAQTCTLTNATGAISGANVTDVDVTCTTITFTVTASGGAHGTVSPASKAVDQGDTTVITITPDPGYKATASGCGGTLSGTTYTTGPISADCTVNAAFVAIIPPVPAPVMPWRLLTVLAGVLLLSGALWARQTRR